MKTLSLHLFTHYKQLLALVTFGAPILSFGQIDQIGQFSNCLDTFQIRTSIYQPKCFGDEIGSISIGIQGVNQYQIDWNIDDFDGMTNVETLPIGSYTFTITDNAGCTYTSNIVIQSPPEITISNTLTHAVNNQNGAIDVEVTGGTGTYTFNWNNGSQDEDLYGLSCGTYAVTVYDQNLCPKEKEFTINNHRAFRNFNNDFAFNNNEMLRTIEDDITIYPNPTNDIATVTWKNTDFTHIIIYNEFGTVIEHTKLEGQKQLTLNHLKTGLYRISFLSGMEGDIVYKKLVVQ